MEHREYFANLYHAHQRISELIAEGIDYWVEIDEGADKDSKVCVIWED